MDFHTLWEDADPEISILKQAKAEYAQNRAELCEMIFLPSSAPSPGVL